MKAPLNTARLFIEILAAIAVAEVAVTFLLPTVAPGVAGTLRGLIGAAMLAILAGPMILWRVRAAVKKSDRNYTTDMAAAGWRLKLGVVTVLVLGIGLSLAAGWRIHGSIQTEARGRFQTLTKDALGDVQRRVNQALYGLKGARGVYAASKSVERLEFKAYADSRNLAKEFPGGLGFGFIERVMRPDLDAFIAKERADDAPDFDVRIWASVPGAIEPTDTAAALAPDLYIYKHTFPLEPNRASWGFDAGSEPVRREAIERAIATGEPAITGRIRLVQRSDEHVGFLYLVPIFRNGTQPTTPVERLAALTGLVVMPIVLEIAMADLQEAVRHQIDLEIFDGPIAEKSALLFDMDDHLANSSEYITQANYASRMFETEAEILVGGRTWTATLSTTPTFEAQVDTTTPVFAAVGGALLTMLGAVVMWTMGTGRARALALAASMTRELREAGVRSERLAEIARRTSNAVIITDSQGRITWANEGFTKVSGYTLEEALGKVPGHLLQFEKTDPKAAETLRDAVRGGVGCRVKIMNRGKDGREYVLDIEIQPLHDAAGMLTGFMAIESDITEQVEAGNKLREATARLEEAQTVARMGNWSFDLTTGKVYWSKQVYALFGRREADGPLDYAGVLSDYHPDDAPILDAAVWTCTTEGTPYSLVLRTNALRTTETRYVRGEGRARFDASGKIVALFGTVADVTAEVESREALLKAQAAAEAASRSKSEFLANMSHEIRTPLTAILGYADLLREDGDAGKAPARRIETIDTIRNAGTHLLTVINDILDISKIEADKMTVERVATPLTTILQEVVSLTRPRAAGKGVTLTAVLASPVPDLILSDPTRLRQILMNLAGNAAKFTEAGTVTITARTESTGDGSWLIIDIDDTGPGMTQEQADRLFQSFSQADSTVTRKHGGTGLGLTICRRLASLMEGGVTLARTEPGKGSCFRVELPLEAAPGAVMVERLDAVVALAKNPAAVEAVTLSGRILLAEDGIDNQRLIAFHLRKAGATVDIADTGRIALEMIDRSEADKNRYDLLLTDMQMPEMDGYTLARTLRDRGSHLAIVALTAHAMAEDRQKCLDSGCDDYASKPIEKAKLLSTCAAWIGKASNDHVARRAAA